MSAGKVARLTGALDFATVAVLLDTMVPPIGREWTVDLSGVTQSDSSGLALLLELKRRATAAGADVKFLDAPAQLADLAAFFGIKSMLGVDATAR